MPLVSFYTPWKHQKIKSFLMFSEGTESDQWYEMGSWLTRQIILKMLTSPQTSLIVLANCNTIEALCMWIICIDAYIIGADNIVPITNPLPIQSWIYTSAKNLIIFSLPLYPNKRFQTFLRHLSCGCCSSVLSTAFEQLFVNSIFWNCFFLWSNACSNSKVIRKGKDILLNTQLYPICKKSASFRRFSSFWFLLLLEHFFDGSILSI